MHNELPGQGEFSQLMADHIFYHEDRQMHLAIVNAEREPYHLGHDRAITRPGLDNSLAIRLYVGQFINKPMVYVWSFL